MDLSLSLDSDREDGEYCPPVKRERTSSLTQFPPAHSGNAPVLWSDSLGKNLCKWNANANIVLSLRITAVCSVLFPLYNATNYLALQLCVILM